MKGRESGMPDEQYWNSFYDATEIISRLVPENLSGTLVEFGTGYGTFTIPAAERVAGNLIGFDIEKELIRSLQVKCNQLNLNRVTLMHRDFCEQGTGLGSSSTDHILLYNILHIQEAPQLLEEAFRILKVGASISIIHWRSDIETPRGPSLSIRPTVKDCVELSLEAGFNNHKVVDISDVSPYHFGITVSK